MASSGIPIIDGTEGDRSYRPYPRKAAKPSSSKPSAGRDPDEREEFRAILDEVQKLGASQLDWKERKDYEAGKLTSLGAKPAKSFKMPISMGLNIKRKREKLEAQSREQDILAGILPTKNKRRVVSRGSTEDRGLQMSEGKFRGGVLYVQKPVSQGNELEQKGRGGALSDRMFGENLSRGSSKHKGKGRGKNKGGKNKGGKNKGGKNEGGKNKGGKNRGGKSKGGKRKH